MLHSHPSMSPICLPKNKPCLLFLAQNHIPSGAQKIFTLETLNQTTCIASSPLLKFKELRHEPWSHSDNSDKWIEPLLSKARGMNWVSDLNSDGEYKKRKALMIW